MTRKDVRKLLGEPLRVEMPAVIDEAAHECWLYEYELLGTPQGRPRGFVRFCPNDGRVLSWHEPNWAAMSRPDSAAAPDPPKQNSE
jgi:hypothetical protein